MFYVFLFCAVIGGTVFVFQFLLAVLGMGTDDLDFGDDIPDDVDLDVADDVHHSSTWLFGVISFRTVVAALTFFGLTGMAALQSGVGSSLSAIIAVGCGFAAMWSVHWLMQKLYQLRHDGTMRIERSLGKHATVYVPIPANQEGCGKIQIRLQNRIAEYAAMTSEAEKLPTGAKVVVVDIISPTTLAVEPLRESITS